MYISAQRTDWSLELSKTLLAVTHRVRRYVQVSTLATIAMVFLLLISTFNAFAAAPAAKVSTLVAPVIQTKGSAPSGGTFKVQPVIQIQDATGLPTSGIQVVTVAISNGFGGSTDGTLAGTTTVSATSGRATFTNLSITGGDRVGYDFTFSSPGLTSSTLAVSFATKIVLTTNPVLGLPGEPMVTQPVVQIVDAAGNVVLGEADPVTIASSNCYLGKAATGGTGSVIGSTTSGRTTFDTLFANDNNENSSCSFSFFSGALLSSTSITVSAPQPAAGSASQLVLRTSPVVQTKGSSPAGGTFKVQPILFIKDAAGFVTTSTSNVTVSISNGYGGTVNGTLLGATTVAAVSGKVTFSGLSISGGNRLGYDFTFSSPGLPSVSATVRFATQIILKTPIALGDPGSLATISPVAAIADADGNVIDTATDSVALTTSNCVVSSAKGGPNSTISANSVRGIATFTAIYANHGSDSSGCDFSFGSGSLLTPAQVSRAYFAARSLTISNNPSIESSGKQANSRVQPVISVIDASGRIAGGYTGAITYAIVGTPYSATETASAGVVNFTAGFSLSLVPKNSNDWSAVFTAPGLSTLNLAMYDWLKPTLIYDGNGSSGGQVPPSTIGEPATPAFVALNTGNLTNVGLSFSGWNTESDGSGTTYSPGSKISMPNSGLTLYAVWKAVSKSNVTITFADIGADSGSLPGQITGNEGDSLLMPTNSGNLARLGFRFAGWNTSPDGSGSQYDAGVTFMVPRQNLNLYPRWSSNNVQIAFSGNGSDSGSAPDSIQNITTDLVTLPGNSGNFVKSGYFFVGWNSLSSGEGENYSAATTIISPQTNLILFAHWVAKAQLVRFDGNGATSGAVPSDQYVSLGKSTTLDANSGNLTRDGFRFTGWSLTPTSASPDFPSGGTALVPSGGLTLYATWQTAASKLVLTQAPVAGLTGNYLTQQPHLELQDKDGVKVPVSCLSTVSVESGSVGTVSGTVSQTSIAGVIRYTDLAVSGLSNEPVTLLFQCSFGSSSLVLTTTSQVTPAVNASLTSLSGNAFTLYHYLSWGKWTNAQGATSVAGSKRTAWNTVQDFSTYMSSIKIQPIWVVYEPYFSSVVDASTPSDATTFYSGDGLTHLYVDETKIKAIADQALLHPEMPVSFDTEFGNRFVPATVVPATLKILSLFKKYDMKNPVGVYAEAPQVMFGWQPNADPSGLNAINKGYLPVAQAVDFLSPMLYYMYNPLLSDWMEVANYSLLASSAYGVKKPIIPYLSFNKPDTLSVEAYTDAMRRLKYVEANGASGAIIWESSSNPPVFTQYGGWGKAMFDFAASSESNKANPGWPASLVVGRSPIALDADEPMQIKPQVRLKDLRGEWADPNVADLISVSTDSGVLSGKTTVQTVGGIADFADLNLTGLTPGAYTLTFSGQFTGSVTVTVTVPAHRDEPISKPISGVSPTNPPIPSPGTEQPTPSPSTEPATPPVGTGESVSSKFTLVTRGQAVVSSSPQKGPILRGASIGSPFYFRPYSAALDARSISNLRKIAKELKNRSGMLVVTGFVQFDHRPIGVARSLALRRALTVTRALSKLRLSVKLGYMGYGVFNYGSPSRSHRKVEIRLITP